MKVKITKSDNFSLLFYKLVSLFEFQQKKVYEKVLNHQLEKSKNELLKELVENYNSESGKKLADQYVETLKDNHFEVLELKAQTRLVVGMGIPSFFENGISLHHTYGVPYIPASSVKGLLRFTYLVGCLDIFPVEVEGLPKPFRWKNEDLDPEKVFEILRKLEDLLVESENFDKFHRGLKEKGKDLLKEYLEITDNGNLETFYTTYVELFGTQHQKGKTIFADAIATNFRFVVDIMTPHFTEYYQSSEKQRKEKNAIYLIADIHTPTPIPFLAVEKESRFAFMYKTSQNSERKELIKNLLKEGLKIFGIGGKRRKGYGYLI